MNIRATEAPKECAKQSSEPAMTTVMKTWILHRKEIIRLNGDCFRMK